MTRVLFFGSSAHSLIILNSLQSINSINLIGVVTKIDKPQPNPVALFSKENKIPLFQTDTFDQNFLKIYKDLKPDLVLVVA